MKDLQVLFLILCCTKVIKTVVPKVKAPLNPVLGVVGDDLILPCYLENNVSAVDMEVQWIIEGNRLVHHYKSHTDQTANLVPQYHNRTSLFKDELLRGNISLMLSSVRLSDTNTYTCYVKNGGGPVDSTFRVKINGLGNNPVVYPESHNNGSVTLVCLSNNWTSKPAMDWIDGKGEILQHAEDSEFCYSNDTTLYVKRSVTVQENHGSNYTCRVSYLSHRREEPYTIPRKYFARPRHHWALFVALFLVLFPYVYCVKWLFQKHEGTLSHFKKQVLKDNEALLLAKHGHRPIRDIQPQIIQIVGNGDEQIYKNISLEHMFSLSDGPAETAETESAPKVIVLHGRSGHGKSYTAQRIVRDWALEADYLNQFYLVLLLRSGDLKDQMKYPLVKKKLVDFVNSPTRFRPMFNKTLKKSPDKVLFIIDGFDELVFSEEGTQNDSFSPFSPASIEDHLLALLSRQILPESSLIVTTRSSALDRLSQLIQQKPICSTEILGFSKENIKEYFKDTYSSVEANGKLFATCCVPSMCCMICTILQSDYNHIETQRMAELETFTSLFVHLVMSQVEQHYGERNLNPILVKDLFGLVEGGIMAERCWRSSKYLSDLKRNPFLCKQPRQNLYRLKYYIFKEFFTTLHYIIQDNNEGKENVKNLLKSVKEDALNRNTHHLSLIRFLFGLSNIKVKRKLGKMYEEFLTSIKPALLRWIHEEMPKKHVRHIRLILLQCLYELHEEEVVKEAMARSDTVDTSFIVLNELDCLVLQYCLQCCPNIRCLKLRKCRLTPEKLKLLTPVLGNLQELRLDAEDLADDDVKDLISSLKNGEILAKDSVIESSEPQVIIRLSAVKNLISETAAELLKAFQNSKKNSSLSIELAEESNDLPSVCSSISVNKDKDSFEVHVLCGTQQSGNGPVVSLMSLTMVPSEASSPDWSDIMNWLSSGSSSSKENATTQLQECLFRIDDLMKARFIVNDLIQDEANEMFSQLAKKCCKLTDLRLETYREGGERISLSLNKVKTGIDCLQVTGYSTSEIALTLLERPESSKLTDLLSKIHSMGDAAEDLDEKMDALLSSVSSLNVVKDMTLRVKCLTKSWADGVIRLVQNCPRLQDVKLTSVKQTSENVCSSFSLKKVDNSHLRVTALCSSEISNVSLILPLEEVLKSECSKVFHQIHSLRSATENELDQAMQILLCMPGLEYVDLSVSCLTEIWTRRILSTISGTHGKDREKKIKADIYSGSDDRVNLCSSITVEKEGSKFRLTANNWMVPCTSYTAPALSHISVLSETHETYSMNSIKLLKRFHALKTLTDSDPEVDGCLRDLMESLRSLHGLEEVNLKVNSLTESWAKRIINLIHRCTSLKNVRLSAGLNTVAGGLTGWLEHGPLQDDGIKFLRAPRKNMSCNITVSGISLSTQKGNRRQPVDIKIQGPEEDTPSFLQAQ